MKYHFAKDGVYPPNYNRDQYARENGWTAIHWLDIEYLNRLALFLRGVGEKDLEVSVRNLTARTGRTQK